MQRCWRRVLKRLDVPKLPMQSLRPSFETNAHWAEGHGIEKVARIMGHSSTTTTLTHYDRPNADALAANAVEFALRNFDNL